MWPSLRGRSERTEAARQYDTYQADGGVGQDEGSRQRRSLLRRRPAQPDESWRQENAPADASETRDKPDDRPDAHGALERRFLIAIGSKFTAQDDRSSGEKQHDSGRGLVDTLVQNDEARRRAPWVATKAEAAATFPNRRLSRD